jgi:hypothetical protein
VVHTDYETGLDKGYATEGSRALIRKGFTELGVRRVYTETMAVNAASWRVMEKAALRFVRTFRLAWDNPVDGVEHGEVGYELSEADWRQRWTSRRGYACAGGRSPHFVDPDLLAAEELAARQARPTGRPVRAGEAPPRRGPAPGRDGRQTGCGTACSTAAAPSW